MGEYVSGDWPAYYSWSEALDEPPHGAQGAHEAADDAICQMYHGMSRAEWDTLPPPPDS